MSKYIQGKLKATKNIIEDRSIEKFKVADCFGSTIGSANATATELVKRWNCHKDLVKACIDVQLVLALLLGIAKLEIANGFREKKVAIVESRIKQIQAALAEAE